MYSEYDSDGVRITELILSGQRFSVGYNYRVKWCLQRIGDAYRNSAETTEADGFMPNKDRGIPLLKQYLDET